VEGLSRWVVRHRMVVSLLWLAITVVGVLVAPTVSAHLKSGVHVDSAAYTANQQIARQYGGVTSNPGILVINLPNGQTVNSAGVNARLHAFDAQVAKASPGLREVSYASTGSRTLVGSGGKSTIVLVYPPRAGADVPASVLNQLAAAARAVFPVPWPHLSKKWLLMRFSRAWRRRAAALRAAVVARRPSDTHDTNWRSPRNRAETGGV